MRPILPADLDLAARVLLALPETDREAAMDEMLEAADRADQVRAVTGRALPGAGDGSLICAALMRQRAGPCFAGPAYRKCLALVLHRLEMFEAGDLRCPIARPRYMAGSRDSATLNCL